MDKIIKNEGCYCYGYSSGEIKLDIIWYNMIEFENFIICIVLVICFLYEYVLVGWKMINIFFVLDIIICIWIL